MKPDIVTLAKSLGAGLPAGAIGMTPELSRPLEDGSVHQLGTFNGNPLSITAARASLAVVLTRAAYERLERLNERLIAGLDGALAERDLPFHTVGLGSKGCVRFGPERVTDYTSYARRHDREVSELAWFWFVNRGLFMTPGRELEWNLNVAHDEDEVDRFVEVFTGLLDAPAA